VRWKNKIPFDFLLSWQHSCQKLSKSVDAVRSYSKPKQCCFRHSVEGSSAVFMLRSSHPLWNANTQHLYANLRHFVPKKVVEFKAKCQVVTTATLHEGTTTSLNPVLNPPTSILYRCTQPLQSDTQTVPLSLARAAYFGTSKPVCPYSFPRDKKYTAGNEPWTWDGRSHDQMCVVISLLL